MDDPLIKDRVWDCMKRDYYFTNGCDQIYWETPEEERMDRDEWFSGWDDDANWSEPSTIFVDSHY